MAYENNAEPDKDVAIRTGEFAMLMYSIGGSPTVIFQHNLLTASLFSVAVTAGTILPQLARRDSRLLSGGEEDEDAEVTRLRNTVREWRAEASRNGKPLRLPMMPFLLRNIWTGALLLFTILTFSTFFVATVVQVCLPDDVPPFILIRSQATVIISLIGICWAVACWVPFAIIMEVINLLKHLSSGDLIHY